MTRAWHWGKKQFWLLGGAIATVAALVVTYIVVFAMPQYGAFEQRIDARCAPLVVIAFRGSGEGNLDPAVTANAGAPHQYGDSRLITNGWEGVTLDGLFDALSTTVVDGFEADQIPVVPIGPAGQDQPFGYDAILAAFEASTIDSSLTYPSSRLLHSASRGAEAATHLMTQYLRDAEGCPIEPRFVVVGYSQGAMAARHAAELNPEHVIGVVNIGDPYQRPDAPGVRDLGASGIGIIRWKAGDEYGPALDAYYEATRDLRSAICHASDPICEFTPLEGLLKLALGDYGTHLDYYTDERPGEAADDARAIAELAALRWRLALDALQAGQSTSSSCTDAASAAATVRTTSLSFAGTPTLVAVTSAARLCAGAAYEFDLDGDGVFETASADGTVWLDFGESGPHDIAARVVDPEGATGPTGRTTVPVAPAEDGEIALTPPSAEPEEPAAPQAEPEPVSPPRRTTPTPRPPVTTQPPAPQTPAPNDPDPNDPDPNAPDPNAPDPNTPDPEPTTHGSISTTPDPLAYGWSNSLWGEGYPPEVELLLEAPGLIQPQWVWTDDEGGWAIEVPVREDTPLGTYQLTVTSADGADVAIADVFDIEVASGYGAT